jgi:signal transduction histidine kinase
MKIKSISRRLLTRVLSVYFILTFIVTCGQIVAEYYNAKNSIISELLYLEKTFSGSLTRAVWELNTQQTIDIAEGLVAIPQIKAISVADEKGDIIVQLGDIPQQSQTILNDQSSTNSHKVIGLAGNGVFGHSFPLIFEFTGRSTKVGSVTLLSNNQVIFQRIEVGIYFLIGNAIAKTAFLMFLFFIAFSKMLTEPLTKLTDQINQFDLDDPESSKLHVVGNENNELSVLEAAYNNLIDQLIDYKEQLAVAQNEIVNANQKLDEHNLLLEQEVAKKASSLSSTMLEMEEQRRELLKQQAKLEEENNRRKQTEEMLTTTNTELQASVFELKKAQELLLNTEKMASLGSLSAEISHEINTPIGISITSTTYLSDLLQRLQKHVDEKTLSKKILTEFTDNAAQSIELLINNLTRASSLIGSFKQVAVDQTSDKIRKINVAKYLDEIIQSLHPKLKKTNHSVKISCDEKMEITSHAGALAQIITNLVINSIIHGFENINRGEIIISVTSKQHIIYLHYEDNGVGVSEDKMPVLFEPFYTTKADRGGSGLGTHIIYNLVTNTLNGKIVATSVEGKGLAFDIEFADMSHAGVSES